MLNYQKFKFYNPAIAIAEANDAFQPDEIPDAPKCVEQKLFHLWLLIFKGLVRPKGFEPLTF
jgi:hypothetical protein